MGRGSGVFLAGNAMGRLRALAGIGLALPRLSAGDFCRPRRQGDCLGNQLTVTDRTSAESSLALDFSATPFPVVVDWDGDSDEDLVVADERGLRYFERVGAGLVERVGAANPFGGINVSHPTPPAADWVDDTIAIAIADWDSDGDQDLVIGGSIVANFRFFERVAGGGLVELSGSNYPFQLHQQLYYYDGVHRGRCVPAFVDWDGDGDQDLIVGQLEARPLYFERLAPNVLQYRGGEGQDPFWHLALVADHWRVALYPVDMDLDGDVDLVVTSTAHRFVSSADMTVRVERQGLAQYFERLDNATLVERRGASQNPFEGIFGKGAMFVAFLDWNQDGQQDFVFGEEPANDTARLRYYEGSRKVVWEIDDENNPFFGVSQFNFPVPAFLDWDGDGDLDIVTVETGWVAYYDNVAAGFLAGPNWEPFWGLSLHFSLTAPAFADWDHDGNTDMLVFEGAPIPRLRLYARMPDGTLAAPYQFGILRASGVRQTPSGSLYMEYYYPSEAGTAFVDWDGDGELELVVLVMGKSHEVTFRYFQRAPGTETGLLERSGAENPFAGISFSIGSGYAGDDRVFAVPSFVDLDMDGDLDLVVSSAEVLLFFERNSSGLLERRDAPFEPRGEAGVFNCYTFVDWDGDTDPDIVVSARGSPLSLWVFGACTQPSPCSGNGLCTGGHGECKCLVGYVGASCSGCSANYYKRVDTQ